MTSHRENERVKLEILSEMVNLLAEYEDRAICDHGYKEHFFRVFRFAFDHGFMSFSTVIYKRKYRARGEPKRGGLITGDSIIEFAIERDWIASDTPRYEKRWKDLETVSTWWDEWTYAWSMPHTRWQRIHRVPGKRRLEGYSWKDSLRQSQKEE